LFFRKIKKGSKKFREILFCSKVKKKPKNNILNKFFRILSVDPPDPHLFKHFYLGWARNFLSSEIKTFLYKYYNNVLGFNYRIAHFLPEREPECTFCIIKKNFPAERETPRHIFWSCPTTENIIHLFFAAVTVVQPNDRLFFTGIDTEGRFF
jgi:hypothetical protein